MRTRRGSWPCLAWVLTGCLAACGSSNTGTIAKIEKEKIAYVGTVPFEGPLLYQVGKDLVGPEANLAEKIVDRIAENVGRKPGDIKITWLNRTYENLPGALANQEMDFVLGVFAVTEARKQLVQFSDTYYTSELVLVINPANKDVTAEQLAGLTVAVREATGVDDFVQAKFPDSVVKPMKTLDEAILSLRRGEVDAAIDDRRMVDYALATLTGVGHLEVIPQVLGTLDCAVAVQKSDKPLLDLVNSVLAEVKKENLYADWLSDHVGESQQLVERRHTDRLEKKRQAAEPRQVFIRVSKDSNFDFDIYRMANLRWVIRDQSTGSSYNSSPISFQGSTGVAQATVPPGNYLLSLPKFNFSTPIHIESRDPRQVPIYIRLSSSGVEVRKG